MYKVKEWHCRPTYRKGDLEAEEVVINVTSFKTRKEAMVPYCIILTV